jgi:hypothetical protein
MLATENPKKKMYFEQSYCYLILQFHGRVFSTLNLNSRNVIRCYICINDSTYSKSAKVRLCCTTERSDFVVSSEHFSEANDHGITLHRSLFCSKMLRNI